MLEIDMFPALNGDGLWIRYGSKAKPRHILIDCGFANTTTPEVVQQIIALDPHFDAFILTHIDADHIDGAIQLLLDPVFTADRVSDVWFNGWQHIVDVPEEGDELGALQGEYFAAELKRKRLPWNRAFEGKRIMVPEHGDLPTAPIGDMKLTVLSPDGQRLRKLRAKWKAELKARHLKPGDWKAALELLREDTRYAGDALGAGEPNVKALSEVAFEEDTAPANGSSLAVLAEWKQKKLLLLGDAYPSVVQASLERLGYTPERPLHVDVLKLSHHGSAGNTSPQLLALLTYDHVLISTNGNTHGHPHAEALARVVRGREGVTLHFNYETEYTRPWIKLANAKQRFKARSAKDGRYTLALDD